MTRRVQYLFLLLVIVSVCCRSSKSESSQDESDTLSYQEIAEDELGGPVEFIHSPGKEYVLCTAPFKNNLGISFIIIEKENNNILIPKKSIRGNVSWHDEKTIYVTEQPGMVKENSSSSSQNYYLDVLTQKRTQADI